MRSLLVQALTTLAPNPTPAFIHNPDDAGSVRRLSCVVYSECLTVSYKMSWRGFGCNECQAFRAISAEENRHDIEALASLIGAMLRGGSLT